MYSIKSIYILTDLHNSCIIYLCSFLKYIKGKIAKEGEEMNNLLTSGVLVLLGTGIIFNVKALKCKKLVMTDLLSAVLVLIMIPISDNIIGTTERTFFQCLIVILSIGNLIPQVSKGQYDYKKRLLQRILHMIFFVFSILIILTTQDINQWYVLSMIIVILYLLFMGSCKKTKYEDDEKEIH